jgi:hypothetical protein
MSLEVNRCNERVLPITTTGGTTSLFYGDPTYIVLTGALDHTLYLPDATTIITGYRTEVCSRASTDLRVRSCNPGGTLQAIQTYGVTVQYLCTDTTTVPGAWMVTLMPRVNSPVGNNTTYGVAAGGEGDTVDWGIDNTIFGYYAGAALSGGQYNTAFGSEALRNYTGDTAVGFGRRAGGGMVSNPITAVGAYAGANATGSGHTMVGQRAGSASGFAANNDTLVGHEAGRLLTGGDTTLVGSFCGDAMVANSGSTCVGSNAAGAMISNPITAIGYNAGLLATGAGNSIVGYGAGATVAAGASNTIFGHEAGKLVTGSDNTLVGYQAGLVATGSNNTMVGYQSGAAVVAGAGCTTVGDRAGAAMVSNAITAIGYQAGVAATGDGNTFVGYQAGKVVTAGTNNVCMGLDSGVALTGSDNTLVGYNAGKYLTSGTGNVCLGSMAGAPAITFTTNVNNTILGYNATAADGLTNVTALGYNAAPTANNTCVLGAGQRVVENAAGRIETWDETTLSSTSTGTNSPLLFPTAAIWTGGVLEFNPGGNTNTGLSLRTGNAEAFINGVVRPAYTPQVGHVKRLLIWNGGTASMYVLAGSITTTSTTPATDQGVTIKGRNTIAPKMSAMMYARIVTVTATYTSTATSTYPNTVEIYVVSGTD